MTAKEILQTHEQSVSTDKPGKNKRKTFQRLHEQLSTPIPDQSPTKVAPAVMNVLNQRAHFMEQRVAWLADYEALRGKEFDAGAHLFIHFVQGAVQARTLSP